MEELASVLLVDDGELDAACAALATLDVHIDHLVGEPQARDFEPPYDLIVSNVRRAISLADALREHGGAEKSPWIAIHGQDFLPLRDRLRREGVDYLVVASVDPEVLRLLFHHMLYRGPEKRETPRIPIGAQVTAQCGSYSGPARLLDLTLQGCRLGGVEARPGEEISLRFPSGLTSGRELLLRGHVVRGAEESGSAEGEIAVAFADVGTTGRSALRSILAGQALGTRITPLTQGRNVEAPSPPPPVAVPAVEEAAPEAAPAEVAGGEAVEDSIFATSPCADEPREDQACQDEPGEDADELLLENVDRREGHRALYQRQVTAQTAGSTLVLLARDLSMQGMRIDARDGLRVGSKLRLTVFGGPQQRPAVVTASVAHDDGEQGMVLTFEDLAPHVERRLEKIVGTAPAIEALASNESGTSHMVMADATEA